MDEVFEISDYITVLDGEHIGTQRTCDTNVADVIEMMVGRKMDEVIPRAHRQNRRCYYAR